MIRRDMLLGSGAVALAMTAGQVMAQAKSATKAKEPEKGGHHHHGGSAFSAVMISSGICVEKGQVCLSHCIMLMGEGDKAMAACAKSVSQLLAVCTSLQQLAAQESPYIRDMARIAARVCKDCEAECKKHADKHAACKDCLEACADCRKECEKLIKA
jgi:Cys-rich four helix bundle protein (predicted Tat secretion target)